MRWFPVGCVRILVSKDVETRKNLRSTSVYVQNLGPDCRRAYGRHIEFEHGLGDFARDFDADRYPELLAYRRASPCRPSAGVPKRRSATRPN